MFEVGVGGGQLGLDVPKLASNPVLFDLEQVKWNGPGVVGLQELFALSRQGGALLFELLLFAACACLQGVEVFEDEVT